MLFLWGELIIKSSTIATRDEGMEVQSLKGNVARPRQS